MSVHLTSLHASETSNNPSPAWVICLCADWCGVCRSYRELFTQVATQFPQLRFAWLDVEDEAALVGDLDIETFPTVLVATEDGARFLGALTPHAQTLSRLLESLTARTNQGGAVQTPIDIAALLRVLQASPEFWIGPR